MSLTRKSEALWSGSPLAGVALHGDSATACAASAKIAAQREVLVKELNIREMRASLGQLAELVATEGELVIRRRGEPIARVLPMTQQRRPPDHADLRRRMPLLKTGSADLIRGERDEC